MTAVGIAAVRFELSRCRQQSDHALAIALQLLDKIERDMRERARASRLTSAELASFSYDLDNPLRTDDCERCGFAWQACICGAPGGGP
jgi:hypothetical protein